MTIYAFIDRLDEALPRAIAVSRAAYSARHGIPVAKIKATIRAARFENKESGDVLKAYTARELAGHNSHKAAA